MGMLRLKFLAIVIAGFCFASASRSDQCYWYYSDTTCNMEYSESDEEAPPSIGCVGCTGTVCNGVSTSVWQNSTSNIAHFETTNCGYHITLLGAHACRIYYRCPDDCEMTAPGSGVYKCQAKYFVSMDKIDVYTQAGVCEEEGYGCS